VTGGTAKALRSLVAPGLATLIALAILLGLGFWQLQRLSWKEELIQRIESRSQGPAASIQPEAQWSRWTADEDEFRHVQVSGAFLNQLETPVYGLAPGTRGSPLQGYFLITPLQLSDGSIVMVNRGIVPTPLKAFSARPDSRVEGQVTVNGVVRAPQSRTMFTPADDPKAGNWFTIDPKAIAEANGLQRVAPFYVQVSRDPSSAAWPQGGQTRLDIPNNHLQYAFTWFGIALTLVGVFAGFAWKRLRPDPSHDMSGPSWS
jgi:surfeit locus 1 family protein